MERRTKGVRWKWGRRNLSFQALSRFKLSL
jgi:hypothetical protein